MPFSGGNILSCGLDLGQESKLRCADTIRIRGNFVRLACLRDWSAIYQFNFKHSARCDSDKITRYPVFTLSALDGQPLSKSHKLWLCALSRAENQGMGWYKDRRTVGNKWGSGPALVLGVKAKITLPGDATWKVEALDPTGAPKAVITDKTGEFEIDPSQRTVWWLMTRP